MSSAPIAGNGIFFGDATYLTIETVISDGSTQARNFPVPGINLTRRYSRPKLKKLRPMNNKISIRFS
jgi:hypothetical protein